MGSIGLETDAINVAFHLFAGWSVESSFVRRPGHFTPNCLIRVVLLCAYHMNIAYIYICISDIYRIVAFLVWSRRSGLTKAIKIIGQRRFFDSRSW